MKIGDMIAVYGTLRKGERASSMLRKSEYIGEDRILGTIYDVGSFPGLKTTSRTFNQNDPSVVVDVYLLEDEKTITSLDFYEGFPSLYGRIVTKTESGLDVWVYVYNGRLSDGRIIKSGDWTRREEEIAA